LSRTMSWPVRLTYILFALALTLSLALTAAPTAKVSAEPDLTKWSKVKTPSEKDFVIAQQTDILSIDTMGDGSVVYAVLDGVYQYYNGAWVKGGSTGVVANVCENGVGDALFKSEDGGVTWDDITDELHEEGMYAPMIVSCSPDDADFVVVAGYGDTNLTTSTLDIDMVIGSSDGGDDFSDTGFTCATPVFYTILSLDVSPERDDKFAIALGLNQPIGTTCGHDAYDGTLWIFEAGTMWGGAWKDASDYDTYAGWDNDGAFTTNSSHLGDVVLQLRRR